MDAGPVLAVFKRYWDADGALAREACLRLLCVLSGLEVEALDSLITASGADMQDRVDCSLLLDFIWEPCVQDPRPTALVAPSSAEVASQLRLRGFSVRQLIRFVKDHRILDGRRLSEMSTAEVVRDIVIPKTRERCCAMVDLFDGGPQEPSCLMSHWWGNSFMSLVEAILAHASGQVLPSERMCTPEQLEKTYWLCIFGVNQHVSICGTDANPCGCSAEKFLNDHPLCEMDKFGLMMQRIPEHAVAVDDRLSTLSRLWVLKELHTALSMGLDSEFCGRVSSDFSVNSLRSVQFGSASREEDRLAILSEIEESVGFVAFDANILEKVKRERAKFAMTDAVMRRQPDSVQALLDQDPSLCNAQLRCFSSKSPLHFLMEQTRSATENQDATNRPVILEMLLQAHADPNLPDCLGRTVLHAVCQWGGSVALARQLVEAAADVAAKITAGPLCGKTAAEILAGEDTIKLEHMNRGLVERSTAAKDELLAFLLEQGRGIRM